MDEAQRTPPKATHSRVLKVRNKMGIHARPAAMIVRLANKFNETELTVIKDGEEVNGKSIMGLMMLAAGNDTALELQAAGPQAVEMLDAMEELFERKFEES